MKRNRSSLVRWAQACAGLLAVQLVLVVSTERAAQAYVDPGSGALVWQGLLATLVGTAFYFRRIFTWVKAKLHKERD